MTRCDMYQKNKTDVDPIKSALMLKNIYLFRLTFIKREKNETDIHKTEPDKKKGGKESHQSIVLYIFIVI